jgi:hypothetical protein
MQIKTNRQANKSNFLTFLLQKDCLSRCIQLGESLVPAESATPFILCWETRNEDYFFVWPHIKVDVGWILLKQHYFVSATMEVAALCNDKLLKRLVQCLMVDFSSRCNLLHGGRASGEVGLMLRGLVVRRGRRSHVGAKSEANGSEQCECMV